MEMTKLPPMFSDWKIVKRLGQGSFGTVYEIERDLFGKTEKAALKYISIPQREGDVEELYSNGYDNASITAHFKGYLADIVQEYSLMAEIKGHTNVVYCDDIRYIQHDESFGWDIYIKMELLTPMTKRLDEFDSDESIIKLGRDICNALILCEDKGIVHRDIKPQNIFVSDTGDYKLGDFGIARTMEHATQATAGIGTYAYMAPEIHNNQPYDSTVDIYSLGLVMYWLLNERRLPFLPLPPKAPTKAETESARTARFSGKAIPAPKNGSKALKAIVLKACAYDPKDRYQSATDMLADLNALDSKAAMITAPIMVPADDKDEEGTIGPVFGNSNHHEEETIGPDFTKKTVPPKKKKKIWPLIAAGVGVVFLVIAMLLMLKSCSNDPGTNPSSTPAAPTDAPNGTSTTQTQNKVESITVKSAPVKTAYFVGDTLDTTGLTLSVVYADGTSTLIADGFTCDKTTLDEAGTYDVVITYAGVTTTFTVEVKEPSVTQIHISTLPTKTKYYIGDAVDTAGLELTVTYDNGKEETMTEGFVCTPEIFAEAGEQTVTISYGGQSVSYEVEVQAVTLTGISIKSEASKRRYYEGDALDVAGLTLLAVYSNGETQTITGGFTCDPMELTAVGKQTITVTYGLYIATFEVDVEEVVLNSISVCQMPKKTHYIAGEQLDPSGMSLWMVANNGQREEVIVSGIRCYPTYLDVAGWQTITVFYEYNTTTFTTTFEVYVEEKLELNRADFVLNGYGSSWNVYSGNIDRTAILWTSSNEDVAIVENGKVIAKGNGVATITAEYEGQKATCIVRCNDVIIVSFTLSSTEFSIRVGSSYTLVAFDADGVRIDPSELKFYTAKEGFFTVDETGKVTGIQSNYGYKTEYMILYVEYKDEVLKCIVHVKTDSQMIAWNACDVANLSFHTLVADPVWAFQNQTYGASYEKNYVTINEFQAILQQLYDNGYVLVSLDDFYYQEFDTNSNQYVFREKLLRLPAGKKPIMLTQTGANYYTYMVDSDGDGKPDAGTGGFAYKLCYDGSKFYNTLVDSNGDVSLGSFDMVPLLEDFIAEHPDFSYNGARAIISFSGYDGILGYRINSTKLSVDEQMVEVDGAAHVLEALRNAGYELACYTYDNCDYGNMSVAEVQEDIQKWMEEITRWFGTFDILVYARNADIAGEESYLGNSKFNVLYNAGFKYFLGVSCTLWNQVDDKYVRHNRLVITGYDLQNNPDWYAGMFDTSAVLDDSRG